MSGDRGTQNSLSPGGIGSENAVKEPECLMSESNNFMFIVKLPSCMKNDYCNSDYKNILLR